MALDRHPLDMENIYLYIHVSGSSYRSFTHHRRHHQQQRAKCVSERRKIIIIYRVCEQLIKLLANLCRSRVDFLTLLYAYTMKVNLLYLAVWLVFSSS